MSFTRGQHVPTGTVVSAFNKTKGAQPHHTILSDINEITCFVALCDPTAVKEHPITALTTTKPIYSLTTPVIKEFEGVNAALAEAGNYDAADKAAFALIQSRFQTVKNSRDGDGNPRPPKWRQAAGIKMAQGYNEAIFLIAWAEKEEQVIGEAYFTNTPTLLMDALTTADPAMARRVEAVRAVRAHPADVVIKVGNQVRGVSLKASFGSCPPVIANMGMGGSGQPWNIRTFLKPITGAYNSGDTDQKRALMRAATLAVVGGIVKVYGVGVGGLGARGGTQLLQELLHCQPGNLPYFLVAAQIGDCYGIDFVQFGTWLQGQNYNVKHEERRSINQNLVFTSTTGGDVLKLGFRVKRSGKTSPSLKVNVTLTPGFKTILKTKYALGGVHWYDWAKSFIFHIGGKRRDFSQRSGSKSKHGGWMKTRSGRVPQLPTPKEAPRPRIIEATAALTGSDPETACLWDAYVEGDGDAEAELGVAGPTHHRGGYRKRKRRTKRRTKRKRTKRKKRRKRRKRKKTRRRRRNSHRKK